MAKPRKVPYYMMESSAIPFTNAKWKGYMGSEGCVPLNTQKTVSMDRLAPGEVPPPKPTPEQVKTQKAEEERQQRLAQLAKQQSKDKPKEKVPEPVDEECENPSKVKSKDDIDWDYLMTNGLDKPVDARRGMIRKFREQDVFFPIYNKSYNDWREKHNRGGDFMIYSKPKYIKLKKPIEFSLETLCRPPEKL